LNPGPYTELGREEKSDCCALLISSQATGEPRDLGGKRTEKSPILTKPGCRTRGATASNRGARKELGKD
jgi:hypothetical protein